VLSNPGAQNVLHDATNAHHRDDDVPTNTNARRLYARGATNASAAFHVQHGSCAHHEVRIVAAHASSDRLHVPGLEQP